MADQIKNTHPEIFEFASLEKYSWRQRIAIYLIDYILYFTILLIGTTVRFEEVDGWTDGDAAGYESYEKAFENMSPGVFAFWHNRIFLMTYFWRKFNGAIMSSQSFDGEYISRTAQRFGYGVIRGSSTRGGSKALKKMIALTKKGIRVSFTIDGPKGPRYKVKPGALLLAKQSGVPIGPTIIEAKKYWTIDSWDKLQIPKPFTKAKVFVAKPVFVSPEADKKEMKAKRQELQDKLDELVSLGKQWRESKQ